MKWEDPLEKAKREARKRLEPGGDHDVPFERKGFENLSPNLLKKLLETMELAMLGLLGGKDDGEDE